jgi:iron complex transport system substrate-binding protein
MSRSHRTLFVALAFLLSVATPALRLTAASGPGSQREVTDSTGHKVMVPKQPTRVLSLCTTATDTAVRLGVAERLAGIDEYSRVVPGASNLPVLGKGSAISREQVIARGIDLAFVWWFQEDAARMLEGLGVPAVRIRCGRMKEVPETIRCVGDCLGAKDAAEALAARSDREIAALAERSATNGPRVYVELYTAYKTSGRDSFLNDLVRLAGGRNVAEEGAGNVLFSAEQLLKSDPEVVILMSGFGTPEEFTLRAGLGGLKAVRTGRIHVMDRYWLVAGAGATENVARLKAWLAGEISKQE